MPAGVTAVIRVGLTTVNDVAAVPSKVTAVAPVNPVPVIVTAVPPVLGPELGLMLDTTGWVTALASAGAPLSCSAARPPGPAVASVNAPSTSAHSVMFGASAPKDDPRLPGCLRRTNTLITQIPRQYDPDSVSPPSW
ncbi:hypothetical protein GCM10010170_078010 [Dactylosporangium salmoneum]|uniref:Uncharacterized protein n=1 Tax=Dactylosporangium salmoneum TaxID=53361 RepID=A0ABN3HB62_9ACTN